MKIIFFISAFFIFPLYAYEQTQNFDDLKVSSVFNSTPEDDPSNYDIPNSRYNIEISKIYWPFKNIGFSNEEISFEESNTDVSVEFFDSKLFVAFRSAPIHFPNPKATLYVFSTSDGKKWDLEWRRKTGKDLFSPQLVSFRNSLTLFYVNGAAVKSKFLPESVERVTRFSKAYWSSPQKVLADKEVPYEFKVRNNTLWMSSFSGSHQNIGGGLAEVLVHFRKSYNGLDFFPENDVRDYVNLGGVSQVSFEFDEVLNLWGIGKNLDGDYNGFGSTLVFAPNNYLSYWTFGSTPKAYYGARTFRYGSDLFVIARKDLARKPFDWFKLGPYSWKRWMNWTKYLITPKTTALYKFNKDKFELEWVMDLPGVSDTGEVSVKRVDAHTFFVANHSSDFRHKNRNFLRGRNGASQIYFLSLKFFPSVVD